MNKIFTCLILFQAFRAGAQSGIVDMIQAERSFAAYAVQQGTKNAFLKFLDSSGVVFENGHAINGIQAWSNKKNSGGILNWHPQFAEISSSGELGYTTGPWTYQKNSLQDSVLARGQYSTVWHKTKNKEWKFLVDMGTSYATENTSRDVEQINTKKSEYPVVSQDEMLKAEAAFISMFQKDKMLAYGKFTSSKSILNHPGLLPATDHESQLKVIKSIPEGLVLVTLSSGLSLAGDLGFTYGTADFKGKKQNYLHVWRLEPEGWKIALEVLQY